ncbi:MAG: DUF2341 domain-containing protein [Candidatus Acidiferrales bacterium]
MNASTSQGAGSAGDGSLSITYTATGTIAYQTVAATVAENLSFTVSSVAAKAIIRVNQNGNYRSSNNMPLSASSTNATAGNLVVIGISRWFGSVGSAFAENQFSGSNVGTIHLAVQDTGAAYSYSALLWTTVVANGTITVTWTPPGSETEYVTMGLAEYSGANTSNPIDSTNHNHGNSASATSGNVSVAAGEVLVGFVGSDNYPNTKPAAYSEVYNQPQTSGFLPADMADYLPSAGTYNTQWTITGTDDWTAAAASLKPAADCTADDGATVNQINTTATSVPFGFISPNTFYQGCQDLYVSTNSGGGYSVTVQEKYAMRTANGLYTIPDTTCDAGDCSVATATTWVTPTKYGLGHTCKNQTGSDCAGVYADGTKFRPIANTAAGTVQNTWYNSNWGYRKRIRIASAQVAGSATSFPVLISSTDPAWRHTSFGGHVASATGWDFVITDSGGVTKLDHEIETYASSTGALVAWVRVPFLSTTTVNELFVYYGNAAASDQQNKTGVWNANYAGVWHMTATSTNTTLTYDSTANASTGTKVTAAQPANTADGKIDGAQSFDGSGAYVNTGIPTSLQLTHTGTVAAWVKYGDQSLSGGWTVIAGNYNNNTDKNGYSLITWSNRLAIEIGDGTAGGTAQVTGSTTYNDNLWHYAVGTWDGSILHIYVDGAEFGTGQTQNRDAVSNVYDFNIGRDSANANVYYNGLIDEVHVANTALSPSWIATEYNNQNSPSTFYSMFPEELQGSAGQVIMANFGPVASSVSRAKYRLSVSPAQTAGTYTTVITYTILGTF